MPQLDFASFPTQLFWLAVVFGLMYLVLAKRVLPQIASVIDKRQSKLSSDLKRAHDLQTDAEQLRHEYEMTLQSSRQKAHTVLQQVTQKIAKVEADRSAKLEESLQRQMEEAETRIAEKRQQALREMEQVALETTREILVKFLDKSVPEADIKRLIKG